MRKEILCLVVCVLFFNGSLVLVESQLVFEVFQQAPYEPPIMITYDLHADPFFQGWTLDQRRNAYYQWLDNAQWLLDFLEPYGGKVTFLSVGEFMNSFSKTRPTPFLL